MIARKPESKSDHRILIVDDHEPTLTMLESLLERLGYRNVSSTSDSRRVLMLFREIEPDLVMLDLHMPGLNGFDVLRQITSRVPDGEFLPVIVFSGDLSTEAREGALTAGAADFIGKPIIPTEVALRFRNLLRLRDLTSSLEAEVQSRVKALRDAELDLANRLALVSEYRDYPDGAHVQRVGRIAALIAKDMGRPDDEVMLIRYAAPLHDLGKVAVPESILLKPGSLSKEEADIVKAHTTTGARMLAGSRSPVLQLAEEIALYHHENWDGTGYTADLQGEDIPLAGRIVAVADVFDALTHPRPYKKSWTSDEALAWMRSMSGRKFDPSVVNALVAVLGETPGDGHSDLGVREPLSLHQPRASAMPGGTAGVDAAAWPGPPDWHAA